MRWIVGTSFGHERRARGVSLALALAGIAIAGAVASAETPEDGPTLARTPYDIDSAADVDRAVAEKFGPRRPPIDTAVLGSAWKAVVADAARPPVKIILDTDSWRFIAC